MKAKLKLSLEQLTVDSFNTTAAAKPKGTVFGEQCTCYTQCMCPGCPSCYESCNGTCDDTCVMGCTGYSECDCPQSCPTVCVDGPCCD